MKNTNKETNAQGAKVSRETENIVETFDGKTAKELKEKIGYTEKDEQEARIFTTQEEKKKERTPNTIYTLKQMRNMINKIAIQKMASVEELTQLRTIHKAMTERWIGLELKD